MEGPWRFYGAKGQFEYNDTGMSVLKDFFGANTNFPGVSSVTHAKTAADVDSVLAQTFLQCVPVYKFP